MNIYIIVTDDNAGTNLYSFLDRDEADACAMDYIRGNMPELKDMPDAGITAAIAFYQEHCDGKYIYYEIHQHHHELDKVVNSDVTPELNLLIDIAAGVMRPAWTNVGYAGALPFYLEWDSKDSTTEEQMEAGYLHSAGTLPRPLDPADYQLLDTDNPVDPHTAKKLADLECASRLKSLRYPEDSAYYEVSRCQADPITTVILYEASMTAIVRNGTICWIARLD